MVLRFSFILLFFELIFLLRLNNELFYIHYSILNSEACFAPFHSKIIEQSFVIILCRQKTKANIGNFTNIDKL